MHLPKRSQTSYISKENDLTALVYFDSNLQIVPFSSEEQACQRAKELKLEVVSKEKHLRECTQKKYRVLRPG